MITNDAMQEFQRDTHSVIKLLKSQHPIHLRNQMTNIK